ncbi:MAG: hypothetical protein V3T02_05140 [Alphaproteobacteria bacterium]
MAKRLDYFAAICLAVSALVAVVIAAVPLHYFTVVFMFTTVTVITPRHAAAQPG